MGIDVVTGGAGFIGSHLVAELLRRGRTVRVVDDFSTGRADNLAAVAGLPLLTVVKAGLADFGVLREACRGADRVFHLAAAASVPRSVADPVGSHVANAGGTLNVLVAARDAGVRRVVYSGSSSAYGDSPVHPKVESLAPAPVSPYAASKLAGEHYCRAFSAVYGLSTAVLRYFNIFGPRQDPSGPYAAVLPLFAAALREGRRPVIYGDGSQSRDFTYVANAVAANLLAGDCAAPLAGEPLNIGTGRSVTVLAALQELGRRMGVRPDPEFRPPRVGDVQHSEADITAARQVLGYEPVVGFDEGLRRLVDGDAAGMRSA